MDTVELLGIIHHILGIVVAILGFVQMSKQKEKGYDRDGAIERLIKGTGISGEETTRTELFTSTNTNFEMYPEGRTFAMPKNRRRPGRWPNAGIRHHRGWRGRSLVWLKGRWP